MFRIRIRIVSGFISGHLFVHLLLQMLLLLPLHDGGRPTKAQELKAVFRIRIQIGSGFNKVTGSGSGLRAKMTHKIDKKIKKFLVLKCWMFSFAG